VPAPSCAPPPLRRSGWRRGFATELFASFTSAVREAMFDVFADRELQLDATPAHLHLAAAIRAGDPEAASAATSAHLEATIRTLEALLDQPGQGTR
jgi:DNA-binding FadR family transcriptional regulator